MRAGSDKNKTFLEGPVPTVLAGKTSERESQKMNENAINNKTIPEVNATVLAGRYRVVRQLGQGGMGSVWLAEDTKLDNRLVAIKMLPSILVGNKRAYAQVKAEALVSLKLSHPNIVSVRAFEEVNGSPFLVMDYIEGQTLDDYLAEKGALTEEEAVGILRPVAEALDYAHGQGVVHRDVKPGNVMIRKDGTPFVMDFGIAREIQETMTRVTGKLSSGTLMYMGPEQLNGDAPKPAQDVYSFAAMAYECLMGHPPFSRGQIEYQIINNPPKPLPDSFAMASQVMVGLSKSPADRPVSCAAVLAAGETAGVEPSPSRRSRTLIAAALLGVLALAGGVLSWMGTRNGAEGTPRPTTTTDAEPTALPVAPALPEAEPAALPAVPAVPVAPPNPASVAPEAERRRLEMAAESTVYALSVEMESAARRIAEEKDEVREFFAAEIHAFENAHKMGKEAKADKNYVTATNFLVQAKARADALKKLVTARADCLAAKERAEEARRLADATDAKAALAMRYAEAERALGEVVPLVEKRDFAKASECAGSARGQFAALRADVIKITLGQAQRHQAAERWQECLAAAEKVLGWEPQNAEAAALKAEAESHLAPTLRVVAKIGDREVPATAMFGGSPHRMPLTLDKNVKPGSRIPSSDVAVEYTEGDTRYEGTISPLSVDWQGLKTIAIVLTKCRGVQLWEGGPYWAECNVGASRPEEAGYYFWWGDTVGYKRNANDNGWISVKGSTSFKFSDENCPTYKKSDSELRSMGYIDATGNLVSAHDAATVHRGAPWRMPTKDEIAALEANCTTTWTTRNGVNGRLVTGKGAYASKSIFLPAAGKGYDSYLFTLGSYGHYWSGSDSSDCAWDLYFTSGDFRGGIDHFRYIGSPVRPVRGFAE